MLNCITKLKKKKQKNNKHIYIHIHTQSDQFQINSLLKSAHHPKNQELEMSCKVIHSPVQFFHKYM
jgi:hypothetical protein